MLLSDTKWLSRNKQSTFYRDDGWLQLGTAVFYYFFSFGGMLRITSNYLKYLSCSITVRKREISWIKIGQKFNKYSRTKESTLVVDLCKRSNHEALQFSRKSLVSTCNSYWLLSDQAISHVTLLSKSLTMTYYRHILRLNFLELLWLFNCCMKKPLWVSYKNDLVL